MSVHKRVFKKKKGRGEGLEVFGLVLVFALWVLL